MIQENVGFALGDIRIEQFALLEENRSPEKSVEYLIYTDIDVAISLEEKGLSIILGLVFEQNDKTNIKLEISTDFHIDDPTWESFFISDEIIIPKSLVRRFSEISIGSARGILMAKTRNTEFNDFLLPLMDVNQLIVEDTIFLLEEDE